MGRTPRQRLTQLPMPTRSTEISSECFGSVVLSYLREDEQKPASFFILGDALHQGIEWAIKQDAATPGIVVKYVHDLIVALSPPAGTDVLETSERNMESIFDDARRMIFNWFTFVHPDSDKRHPVYDEYVWPPAGLEVPFHLSARAAGTKHPVWGKIDTILKAKKGTGLRIVDWKSGVKRPGSDFQLNFYRFGADVPKAEANYHMLDRVRRPSIVVEAEDYPGDTHVREQIRDLERQKERVIAGGMPAFRPDWYCDYCPVQHLCPADGDFRKRKQNGKDLKALLKAVEPMEEIVSV